ncbi:hypothetical protein QNI16_17905 [Cytophagaceae bacterium YF14B1]|uniref:Uncharacterized protein n=1 Tax=Xanthocytophaga flava TaxID=3048013 RepID=A0AAE3QNL5_9BACT|nr:hypothetical protein [Xanthocytophaga flavus]MDJ1482385.1 hypothetical protein [Xanthocytophaga flavus]
MNTLSLTELHEEYQEVRKIKLSNEQFTAFITYYPALLVAKTDGEVDEKEWSLLQGLANHIVAETLPSNADKEEVKDYKELFFNEFKYLIDNLDIWDRKFMKTLQKLLNQRPELIETVSGTLYALADVSKGVCEKENTMIEYLRSELKIKDLGKNICVTPQTSQSKATRNPSWLAFLSYFSLGI